MDPQTGLSRDRTVELSLESGCPLCHGPLQVRLSPDGSRGVCLTCQLIVPVLVQPSPAGLTLAFPVTAVA